MSTCSQPCNDMMVWRDGVGGLTPAWRTDDQENIRQTEKFAVREQSSRWSVVSEGAATRIAPSRASPLERPLWKEGVEEKRRVVSSGEGVGRGNRKDHLIFLKVMSLASSIPVHRRER